MRARASALIFFGVVVAIVPAQASGVRDFTRSVNSGPPPATAVTQAQASELTLTLTNAEMRPIQNWIRTAGTLDKSGRVLTAFLRSPDAELIQVGQRTRAYTVNTRTRMNLGKISQVTKQPGGALIEATLPARVADNGARFLMEIVVERGPFLSIPNVSIIEEGDAHVAYVQKEAGHYIPTVIQTGLQGELYTQVLEGLKQGDQVVSVGSFFVDAETKLKSAGMAAMPGMTMAANTTAAPGAAGPLAVVGTDPASNASVKAPLAMIHVMFNTKVDPKVSGFDVTTADGKRVDVGEAMPMGDTMLMAMPKTPLPAGTYKVKWHAAGTDAKTVQGEFAFTVQ